MSKYEDAKETQNEEEDPQDQLNRDSGRQKNLSKEKHDQPGKPPENKEKHEKEKSTHDDVKLIEITGAVLFGNLDEERAKGPKIQKQMISETQQEKPGKIKEHRKDAKKSQEKIEIEIVKEVKTTKEAQTTKERKEKKTLDGKEENLVAVKEKNSGKDAKQKRDLKRNRNTRESKEVISVRTKQKPKSKLESEETAGTPKAESQSTRQKKYKKSATQREMEVRTAREKKPKKLSAEKIKEPVLAAPKTCQEKKEDETPSARERRKEKKRQKRADAAAMHNYTPLESDAERKRMESLPRICSDSFGYGKDFPNWLLEVPRSVTLRIGTEGTIPLVLIHAAMVISYVPPELHDHLDVGDILFKLNGITLKNREHYVDTLTRLRLRTDAQTVTWTYYRVVRVRRIDPMDVYRHIPQGFEASPNAFDYLYCYLYVLPKGILGMNVKSFNGKVFVSAMDNGTFSLARKVLLVGDAILMAEGKVLTDIQSAQETMSKQLRNNKRYAYVTLLIERARNGSGLKSVKLALTVEKKPEMNPRMNSDVTELCLIQLAYMTDNPNDMPVKSILKSKGSKKPMKKRIEVAPESTEAQIGTEYNPQLLLPTPPLPSAYVGAEGGVYAQGKTIMLAKSPLPPQLQQLPPS